MDLDTYLNSFAGRGRHTCLINSNRLMFITQRTEKYTELDQVKMVIKGGCDWIQLRMKDNLNLEVAEAVARFILLKGGMDCTSCLNDNLEIALKAGFFAVHLGKNDMPLDEAWRMIIKKGKADFYHVGATANTFEDILEADAHGATYVGLGPYRFTETKKNLSPVLGLEGYRKIMKQCEDAGVTIPIFAIGGIQLEDVDALMDTGIAGIAVSGAIVNAPNPEQETRRFIKEISRNRPELRDPSHLRSGVTQIKASEI